MYSAVQISPDWAAAGWAFAPPRRPVARPAPAARIMSRRAMEVAEVIGSSGLGQPHVAAAELGGGILADCRVEGRGSVRGLDGTGWQLRVLRLLAFHPKSFLCRHRRLCAVPRCVVFTT